MLLSGIEEDQENRSGFDRRGYIYNSHIPERRSPSDRRNGKKSSDDDGKGAPPEGAPPEKVRQ